MTHSILVVALCFVRDQIYLAVLCQYIHSLLISSSVIFGTSKVASATFSPRDSRLRQNSLALAADHIFTT